MDEILIYLRDLFIAEYKDTNLVKSVTTYTDSELASKMIQSWTPNLNIISVGETFPQSQIANAKDQTFALKLRLTMKSVDLNKYKTSDINNNIYKMTNKVIETLYNDKTLGGLVRGISTDITIRDIDTLFQGRAGLFNCREMFFSYFKHIAYVGGINRQLTTELPQGIQF